MSMIYIDHSHVDTQFPIMAVGTTIISFIFHYLVFLFSPSSHHKPVEHRSRIASTTHAIIVAIIAGLFYCLKPFSLHDSQKMVHFCSLFYLDYLSLFSLSDSHTILLFVFACFMLFNCISCIDIRFWF